MRWELLLLRAQLLKAQKRYREAVEYYEEVMKQCSLEVSAYVEAAQCHHELGNMIESKRLLFLASKVDSVNQGEVISLLKEYEMEE